MDYSKFYKVVTLIAAVVPDVDSPFEQITTSLIIWYAFINFTYAFFSIPVNKYTKKLRNPPIDLSEQAKIIKIFESYENVHDSVTSSEKDFNH